MTREEEVRNAIDTIIPIFHSNGGRTYEQALMASGFEAGVKWAYANHKSQWISVEMSEAKWIDASLSQPEHDVEVIVLLKTFAEGIYKISFGHIVDKSKCVDYDGWNVEGVMYWFPFPKLPR